MSPLNQSFTTHPIKKPLFIVTAFKCKDYSNFIVFRICYSTLGILYLLICNTFIKRVVVYKTPQYPSTIGLLI